jgi:uncharacterized membrane protein
MVDKFQASKIKTIVIGLLLATVGLGLVIYLFVALLYYLNQ